MKVFAIISVLVLLLTLVGVGSLYMTANIYVDACGVVTVEASAQQEQFDALATQLRTGAVIGTPFTSATELSDSKNYQFCAYTIRLKNDCRIPAEMVEVQISPMAGDVMQIGTTHLADVPAGGTADVTAAILTDASMHTIREVTITYYMWGVPFSLKTTVK